MKLKLLIGAIVVIVALYFLKTKMDEKPMQYIENGAPSTATPASGEVRQELTVGFLPVT